MLAGVRFAQRCWKRVLTTTARLVSLTPPFSLFAWAGCDCRHYEGVDGAHTSKAKRGMDSLFGKGKGGGSGDGGGDGGGGGGAQMARAQRGMDSLFAGGKEKKGKKDKTRGNTTTVVNAVYSGVSPAQDSSGSGYTEPQYALGDGCVPKRCSLSSLCWPNPGPLLAPVAWAAVMSARPLPAWLPALPPSLSQAVRAPVSCVHSAPHPTSFCLGMPPLRLRSRACAHQRRVCGASVSHVPCLLPPFLYSKVPPRGHHGLREPHRRQRRRGLPHRPR